MLSLNSAIRGQNQQMKTATCIEDLRALHRTRVPRMFFDYVDRGSYGEETLRANRADFERLRLRPRVLIDIAERDTSASILGRPAALPLILAPVGLTGMQHRDGEIHACRAAMKAGIPYTLSTLSICSLEDVAEAVGAPFWMQLYVMRDRGFVRALIERAMAAQCSALVLTVDLQAIALRHADTRNGMTVPPRVTAANIFDIASKPGWALGLLRGKRRTFGNLHGHLRGIEGLASLAEWITSQFDPALTWTDVAWIRSLWPGKLVLKGICDPDDAHAALDTGVDAIVVSNHGGRQLDGAPSAISVLPRVRDIVGDRMELLFDSGIRSGQDVMRAIALGASACMIGRAYQYGLGAGGEAGVTRAIEIIGNELSVTMGLCGVKRIADIGPHVLADS